MSGRHGSKKKHNQTPNEPRNGSIPGCSSNAFVASGEINEESTTNYPLPSYKPSDSMVAVWGLFAAIIAAVIYGIQAWAMLESNRAGHDALIISQRPWVGIDGPVIKQSSARWSIDFGLKNFGSSPSLHTAMGTDIAYPPIESDSMKNRIE